MRSPKYFGGLQSRSTIGLEVITLCSNYSTVHNDACLAVTVRSECTESRPYSELIKLAMQINEQTHKQTKRWMDKRRQSGKYFDLVVVFQFCLAGLNLSSMMQLIMTDMETGCNFDLTKCHPDTRKFSPEDFAHIL